MLCLIKSTSFLYHKLPLFFCEAGTGFGYRFFPGFLLRRQTVIQTVQRHHGTPRPEFPAGKSQVLFHMAAVAFSHTPPQNLPPPGKPALPRGTGGQGKQQKRVGHIRQRITRVGGPPVDDVGLPPAGEQVAGVKVSVAHPVSLWQGVK